MSKSASGTLEKPGKMVAAKSGLNCSILDQGWHTEKDNRLSQAQFCCTRCGYKENADTNAAKNVLAAGHAMLSLQPEVALAA